MERRRALIAKVTAGIFLILCIIRFYDTISYFIVEIGGNYLGNKSDVIVSSVVNLIGAISILVIAIGCFSIHTTMIKAGLGGFAFVNILSIVCRSYLIYGSLFAYNRLLPGMTYGLLLLMAIRVVKKAQLLSILAALEYLGFTAFILIRAITKNSISVLTYYTGDIFTTILLIAGALMLGMLISSQCTATSSTDTLSYSD